MKKKLTSLLSAALLGGAVPALPAQAPIAGTLGLSSVNSLVSNQAAAGVVNNDLPSVTERHAPSIWPLECWGHVGIGARGGWLEFIGIDARSSALTFGASQWSSVGTGLSLPPTALAAFQNDAGRALDNGGDNDLGGRVIAAAHFPMPLCSTKPAGLAANTGLDVGTIFNVSMHADVSTQSSISLLSVSSDPAPAILCEPPTCPIDCNGGAVRPGGYFSGSVGVYFLAASNLPGDRLITAPNVSIGYTAEDGSGVRANWFGYSSNQQVEVNSSKTR